MNWACRVWFELQNLRKWQGSSLDVKHIYCFNAFKNNCSLTYLMSGVSAVMKTKYDLIRRLISMLSDRRARIIKNVGEETRLMVQTFFYPTLENFNQPQDCKMSQTFDSWWWLRSSTRVIQNKGRAADDSGPTPAWCTAIPLKCTERVTKQMV